MANREYEKNGSSPLTRGKLHEGTEDPTDRRLIPAHAGKTPHPATKGPPSTAHPRSRGENVSMAPLGAHGWGSSPLTRGKLHQWWNEMLPSRLIPAHAGKTQTWGSGPASCPAHPRSRGENNASMKRVRSRRGSSPLTRGKPTGIRPHLIGRRLIPAHAGKTRVTPSTGG